MTAPSIDGCLDACRRCESVIDQVAGRGGESAGPGWAAVGAHLRHCVEHFQQLLEGLAEGVVDYDARERDARLERDPRAMREAFAEVARQLEGLAPGTLLRPLTVVQSAAPGRPPSTSPSCLERELVFLSGHTVHHIAIMALAAASVAVTLSPDLAVAYSTQAYRESMLAP